LDAKGTKYPETNTLPKQQPLPSGGVADYREVLNAAEYALFDKLRNLRKELAEKSGIPVYAVFTNDQLAAMVKKPPKTAKDLLAIAGIGETRVKQYGGNPANCSQ
jgi:superfamily II DNA helicase RecQ